MFNALPTADINTFLLLIVLPVVGWLVRVISLTNKTLGEIRVVLTGFEGQGGVQRQIEALAARTLVLEHALADLATKALSTKAG